MDWIEHLSGPNGGILALSFATGCGCTYGFVMRTFVREARARITELKEEIDRMNAQLEATRQEYLTMLRNLSAN